MHDENIFNLYRYRGVNDPSVYKSHETEKMLINYTIGFVDLCEEYIKLGDRENAVRAARGAMEKCTPDIDRRIVLTSILKNGGLKDEYKRMIDLEIKRLPVDDEESAQAVGTRYLKYSLIEPSLSEASAQIFKAAIRLYPHSVNPWKGYATALSQSGKYTEALTAVDSILSRDPSDSDAGLLRKLILQAAADSTMQSRNN